MRLNKTKYSTSHLAAWLWRHHKGCRRQAFMNILLGLVHVVVGLIGVETLRRLTDVATGDRQGSLWILASVFVTVMLVELATNIVSTWIRAVLGVKAQNDMQRFFFSRILCGKWSGVGRLHSGDMMNRLFGDVGDIVALLTEILPSMFVVVVQFLASFVYLYTMDSMLAVILIVASPVFLLLSKVYFRKMRSIVRRIKDSNSALQSVIQESVQHKMILKVLERGPLMVQRLSDRQSILHLQVRSRAKLSIVTKTIVTIGFTGGYFAALIWGLCRLQDGAITVGVLMAFTQLISRIQRPLLDMARMFPLFVNSFASAERLIELEELPLEKNMETLNLSVPTGVKFDNVSYRYSEKGRTILCNFSHDFKPGSFTAILGETGAGKTTLIRLMLSLLSPTSGKVSLYTETDQISASVATRCNFSYVPQGNTLFSGTIRENLLLGNPNASENQMKEALGMAMAEFVYELPEGLDTVCGENGGGLSEGQAQRLAIARALIRPCKVLLLDEATSALDIQTENRLLQNIKNHLVDTTIIFVTHRLAVVEFTSDQITMTRTVEPICATRESTDENKTQTN